MKKFLVLAVFVIGASAQAGQENGCVTGDKIQDEQCRFAAANPVSDQQNEARKLCDSIQQLKNVGLDQDVLVRLSLGCTDSLRSNKNIDENDVIAALKDAANKGHLDADRFSVNMLNLMSKQAKK